FNSGGGIIVSMGTNTGSVFISGGASGSLAIPVYKRANNTYYQHALNNGGGARIQVPNPANYMRNVRYGCFFFVCDFPDTTVQSDLFR
ncbi:hypothetical protein DK295_15300, partial [Listeria monocytogenes]